MDAVRMTQFPNLSRSVALSAEHPQLQAIPWVTFDDSTPRDAIVLAWARLLHAYTGDDRPVFSVDARVISVDTSTGETQIVNDNLEVGEGATHITFEKKVDIKPFALELDCSRAGTSILKAAADIPLGQILVQLHSFLKFEASRSGLEVQLAALPDELRLSILNSIPKKIPGPEILHALWERRAADEEVAIDFELDDGTRRQITYHELDKESTALAIRIRHAMSRNGLEVSGSQTVIPVLIEQRPELYISLIAILKVGAAFCPINLDAPEDRIQFVIQDTLAKVVVTCRDHQQRLSWNGGPALIFADEDSGYSDVHWRHEWLKYPDPSSPAYVMYTSGSTGKPKGVVISHRAATQSLLAHDMHIPTFHRFLQFAAPTFDVSVFEIFFPLLRGSTIVGCSRNRLLSDLTGMMNKLTVDAAELTPTVVGSLLQKRAHVPGLRILLTIGEMLTRSVIQEFGGCESQRSILYAMYGPTEAAIHCTLAVEMSSSSKVGMIGVPLDTVSTFVLAVESNPSDVTRATNILPIGQIGELAVGGFQLAECYLNRPEQTSEAFIESETYGRLYRTGDKARMLPDGSIECLGRISSGQVKLRGQRIELGEIEQVASRTEGVSHTAASVINGILVVFCLSDHDKAKSSDVLEMCRSWLPRFMVPGDVVMLSNLPRLPSGKTDMKALETRYIDSRLLEITDETEDVVESIEKGVSEIFFDLTGIRPRRTASLTTYGMDSLLAISFSTKLRAHGFNVVPIELLKADTIEQIAGVAKAERHELPDTEIAHRHSEKIFDRTRREALQSPSLNNINPGFVDILPCTPFQSGILAQSAQTPQAYYNWIELELIGKTTADDLVKAFQALAKENDILRAGFVHTGMSYAMVIRDTLYTVPFQTVQHMDYALETDNGVSLLVPLKIQLSTIKGVTRALVKLHHAVYDGWSWELIMDDLNQIIGGSQAITRPQYKELVSYYTELELSPSLDNARTFWQESLEGVKFTPLPNFNSRTDIRPCLNTIHHDAKISLPRLKSLSRELGVSVQSFFQTAFACILSAYIGTTEVIFGNVFSGRTIPLDGIEGLIGPCINTLPIYVDISSCRTIEDLFHTVHAFNRKALEHSMLSLREIKKACGLSPQELVFDSLFVWQETLGREDIPRDFVREVGTRDQLEFSLTLEVEPCEGHVLFKANYQESIFPAAQIHLLLAQLEGLLAAMVDHPSSSMEDLFNTLTVDLLSLENIEPSSNHKHSSLASAVEDFAISRPQELAIEFLDGYDRLEPQFTSLTYKDLNERANRLARYLISLTVSPDSLVCICMEKSVDLYVTILAVIKAGAGYLPLAPNTPSQRLIKILEEADVHVLLTHSQIPSILEVPDFTLNVSVDIIELSHLDDADLDLPFQPSHVAYAVFTSGSTGIPKGVIVTQDNLLSNLQSLEKLYPVKPGSRLLQSCSQAFDVSVFEIFFSWYMGMCLCSATTDVLFHDIELAIDTMKITHLSLTPTVAALVDPEHVPSVEFLVTAGEAVTEKVFGTWAGRGLFQGYGPSETTNICTVNPDVKPCHMINNIGPPLRNTSAFVLSDRPDFSPVPRGGLGEFCFGGKQVCRGYLNLPELTSEKFIVHPLYGRLYRSGDYGRFLPDGSLSFVGRKDDQVKIRGQRVELGEINSMILKIGQIIDCVTLIIEESSPMLVAFFIPAGSQNLRYSIIEEDESITNTVDWLYDELASLLPPYMIPNALVPVSSLPMTHQSKIDKKLLISDFEKISSASRDAFSKKIGFESDITNWTHLEETIATILSQTTSTSRADIGRHTSFSSLGIDSISAIGLSKKLREANLGTLTISNILRHSTVASLSTYISRLGPERPKTDSHTCLRDIFSSGFIEETVEIFNKRGKEVKSILPCTPLQEAMLSAAQSVSDTDYFNHTIFKVQGDTERLRRSWEILVQRHDILRTCFISTSDPTYTFAQIVLGSFALPWNCIEASLTSDQGIPGEIARTAGAHVNGADPPYTFTIVNDANEKVLVVSMHHALYDAKAIQHLVTEAENIYTGNDLSPICGFERFLQYMVCQDWAEADNFWETHLAGFQPHSFLDKMSDQKDTVMSSIRYGVRPTSASKSLSRILSECKKHSFPAIAVYQATWARTLATLFDRHDVCFGNVMSGRTISLDGVENIVGPCFNTIPVRLKIGNKTSNSELVKQAQQHGYTSLDFQLTPLRRIQRVHRHKSKLGTRLFDTLLLHQEDIMKCNPQIWSLKEEIGAMDFSLVCELTPNSDSNMLTITMHYDRCMFSEQWITSLTELFDAFLTTTLTYPSSMAGDYDFCNKILKSFVKEEQRVLCEGDRRTHDAEKGQSYFHEASYKDISKYITLACDILSGISGIPSSSISVDDTIYHLGLDSINAIQVASELKKAIKSVTVGDVLDHPTVKELAKLCQERTESNFDSSSTIDFRPFEQEHWNTVCTNFSLDPSQVEAIRPCTALQSGMLAQFIVSEGSEYLNHVILKLSTENDQVTVRNALETIERKYQMLRCGFIYVDEHETSSMAMVIYKPNAVPIIIDDLGGVSNIDSAFLHQRRCYGRQILDNMQLPCWRVSRAENEGAIYLQLSLHHALYDGQSLQLIFADFARAICGQRLSGTKSIDDLLSAIITHTIQLEDGQESFWRTLGIGATSCKFPDLTPFRVNDASFQTQSKISSNSGSNLLDLCKANGISVQVALQAAWARILSAYKGESSVTFGIVLSGRTILQDIEEIVFPCINTLPVVCSTTATNRALVENLMTLQRSLLNYQFTPLTKIQQWFSPEGGRAFDTIVAYQKLPQTENFPTPWKVHDEKATADFSISIELEHTELDNLQWRITYRQDLLPSEQACLLLEQLDAAIRDTLLYPDSPSDNMTRFPDRILSCLQPKDHEIMAEVNLLHEFVELQAQKLPDKVAFEFATRHRDGIIGKKTWTYAELNAEGNRIAHFLHAQNIIPGALLAVCFNKCPEASFAILGILKAGCAYVAIDPGAPAARKSYIVKDSGSQMVISMQDLSGEFRQTVDVPVVSLDLYSVTLSQMSAGSPYLSRRPAPSDTCYCLYTSGTTGTPKGCELTHENAVQAMMAFRRLFDGHWTEDSRWFQFASFHFDVSVLEQYWSWSVGICVTSAPRDLIFEDLAGIIQELQITHIDLTPSLARLLSPSEVHSLCRGIFITGGEQLKQEILDVWGPTGVIYNGYGPTEATIGVTMLPRVQENGKPTNIGPQFDNVGSYVLRPGSDDQVVRGAVGELCVSGKLVGRGYLNQPKLTAEKFPFLERYQQRVYRTGDLVRLMHDGSFSFLGRADDQVKLRGQRLEVAEINEVIKASVENLMEVVTLVLKHPKQQKEQLISFVVLSKPGEPRSRKKAEIDNEARSTVSLIIKKCKMHLPGYMVPTYVVPITLLPLTANNKADLKKLKELYDLVSLHDFRDLADAGSQEDSELNEKEHRVANILATLTGTANDKIMKTSNIFELGLDSISVIHFSRLLRREGFFGGQASTIMKNPTIAALGRVLNDKQTSTTFHLDPHFDVANEISAFKQKHSFQISQYLEVDLESIEDMSLCTPLQSGILSRSLESQEPTYFTQFQFSLSQGLDLSKLQSSWRNVCRALPILRTRFVSTTDGFAQVCLKKIDLPWVEIERHISEAPKQVMEDHFRRWIERNRALDMLLWELAICRTQDQTLVCLHIFHALYDGLSLPMMLNRVAQEYRNAQDIDYGPDYYRMIQQGPLRNVPEAKEFWTRHLGTSDHQELRSAITDPLSPYVTVSAIVDDLSRLEEARRKLNVTQQALIQTCFLVALQKHTGSPTTIGVVVSGRSVDADNFDKTIGPLFNTIPFRFSRGGSSDWANLVKECHFFNSEVIPFQHTSLRDIMKWCKRRPDQQLFDTLFVFQRQTEDSDLSNQDLWTLGGSVMSPDHPLAFEAEHRLDGQMQLTLVAQGHVYNKDFASELLRDIEKAIQELMHDPYAAAWEYLRSKGVKPAAKALEIDGTEPVPKLDLHIPDTETSFIWDDRAKCIRDNIAELAVADSTKINEKSSILELGLDSIDAIKLSARLRRQGIIVPVSAIMRSPTIEGIMQAQSQSHVLNAGRSGAERHLVNQLGSDLRKLLKNHKKNLANNVDILPVTPLQEAMVMEMVTSNFSRYFNHDILELNPDIDEIRLENAWRKVIESTPILRTRFMHLDSLNDSSTYAQIVYHDLEIQWTSERIAGDMHVQDVLEQMMSQSRDLTSMDPLVRLTMVHARTKKYLILSIAHALYDGWSLRLIHDDVARAYAGKFIKRPSYTSVLGQILSSTSSDDASLFWKHYLRGSTGGSLDASAYPGKITVTRSTKISSRSSSEISAFCKAQSITVQSLGLACWSYILGFYLRSLDVTFGVVLSGRDTEVAQEVCFPTMNTIAFRTVLHGFNKEVLHYVQDMSNDMTQYQYFPLRKIKRLANYQGRNMFDTLFIYQKQFKDEKSELPKLYNSTGGFSDVEYPVCIEMEIDGPSLVWRVACRESYFDSEGSSAMLDRIDAVMCNIIDNPESRTVQHTMDGASICGLPAVKLSTERPLNGSGPETDGISDLQTTKQSEEIESRITKVLSIVSGIPVTDISPLSTIFHLGLDSISAIKVSSLLRKNAINLPVSDLVRAASVRNMAKLVEDRNTRPLPGKLDRTVLSRLILDIDIPGILASTTIAPEDVEHLLPATSGQIYMLNVWQNSGGELFYPTFKYVMESEITHLQLQAAWDCLTKRHQILRTVFAGTHSKQVPIVQVLLKTVNNPIIWVEPERPVEYNRILDDVGSPMVVLYARDRPFGVELYLKIHHALYDAVSLPLLINDFECLCDDTILPQLSSGLDFETFLAYLHNHSNEGERRKFWMKYLASASSSLIKPRSTSLKRNHHFQPKFLESVDLLEKLSRKHGLSVHVFFLAAYARVHARLLARLDHNGRQVVVGIYLANRSSPLDGLPTLAAPTVNLIPLKVDQPLQRTLTDVARDIQHDLQEIGNDQNSTVSLWEIQQWTEIQLDCFVNFIKLPEQSFGNESKIREAHDGPMVNGRPQSLTGLAHSFTKGAYLPSLDIEATIKNGGLDVGLFCPETLLEAGDLSDMVHELREVLIQLISSEK